MVGERMSGGEGGLGEEVARGLLVCWKLPGFASLRQRETERERDRFTQHWLTRRNITSKLCDEEKLLVGMSILLSVKSYFLSVYAVVTQICSQTDRQESNSSVRFLVSAHTHTRTHILIPAHNIFFEDMSVEILLNLRYSLYIALYFLKEIQPCSLSYISWYFQRVVFPSTRK